MNNVERLAEQFRQNSQKSREIAEFIERGQADNPLAELCQRLEREASNKPLGITLLALTGQARQAALGWLYGHNFAVFSLEVSKQIGLLEVHLKDQGYFLEKSTGERLEFDDWDAFYQAATDADLLKNSSSALKLGAQTTTQVRNLQVLLPESAEFIAQSPALLTKLANESNILMLAAPADHRLTEQEQQVMNMLLEDMSAVWPLIPIDELAEGADIPEHGWWDKCQATVTLPHTLLTTHISTQIPPQLAQVQDELRAALQLTLAIKKHQSATEAIQDRYQHELRRLQSRKKREERKGAHTTTPTTSTDTGFWMSLRNQLNDKINDIAKALGEANRKRELPNSTGNATVKQHIERISEQDLNREPGYKTVKLTLSDAYRTELVNVLQHHARQSLTEDTAQVQQALSAAAQHTAQSCHGQLGFTPTLATEAPNQQAIWQDIKEAIGLELRYQGELPKRGFLDRLSEGRKGAMMLLMSVMLLGYIGVDLKNSGWFGFILLPMFIGTVVYTYISFKKDDKHRLEKELNRVREELLATSRRLLTDINRLKTSKLTDHLEASKKQWQQQLEQLARDAQTRQQQEREHTGHKARTRIVAIDAQLAEWQQYRLPVQQLVASATELGQKARQTLLQLTKH